MNTLLLGLALVVSAPAPKDPPKKETAIIGFWDFESGTFNGNANQGKKLPFTMSYEFTKDGKWLVHREDVPTNAKAAAPREYKVDVSGKTWKIDIKILDKIARPGMLGIFKVEGDKLTICFGPSGGDRPTEFKSPEGSRLMLMVLKRGKKKDE